MITPAVVAAIALAAPFFASAEDPGRIYVYAQRPTAARSWLPITCGGVAADELKQGMLFAIDVPPGRHTIGTEAGLPAFIEVRSGEEASVRLDWDTASDRSAIAVLHAVRPEQARKETKYLSYIPPKKALSSSVPKTDPREPAQLRLKGRREP